MREFIYFGNSFVTRGPPCNFLLLPRLCRFRWRGESTARLLHSCWPIFLLFWWMSELQSSFVQAWASGDYSEAIRLISLLIDDEPANAVHLWCVCVREALQVLFTFSPLIPSLHRKRARHFTDVNKILFNSL